MYYNTMVQLCHYYNTTGCPKKSIPKIKVFYKKSRSGIKSKPYRLNTLEGLDMIF